MSSSLTLLTTVKELAEKHEAGQLVMGKGSRYLTLSEQEALLDFAARALGVTELDPFDVAHARGYREGVRNEQVRQRAEHNTESKP